MPWSPQTRRLPPAPGTHQLVQPSPSMIAFTESSLLLGIVIGAGMRLRIYSGSPLRSVQPVLWFLHGVTEDIAIFAIAGALTLFSTRYVWQRRSWSALTAFVIAVCVLHLVWSEVVIFFGHAVRARDLQVGLRPVLFLHSVNLSILYTLTATLILAWLLVRWAAKRSRTRSRTWATAGRLFVLGLLATGLSFLDVPIHQTETAYNPLVALAVLVREWPPTDSQGHFVVPKPELSELTLRHLAPHPRTRQYFDDTFPLAYHPSPRSPLAPTLPSGLKPNLVIILMEGVRSEEIGAYGGTVPGLTPNLDRLAREGTRAERFYSNGNHTPEGELAMWYGLMPSPYEVMLTTRSETPMTGLPELLQRAGWKSFLWIHNGDQNFYRRDRFYLPRGFITIDGRDFPPREPRTNWGFSDRSLVRRAVTAFDSSMEPFAAMVLTVSNHHPFQLPSDAQTHLTGLPPERRGFLPFGTDGLVVGLHTVPMLRTMHYTDEAIGYFFDLAKSRPWFEHTVFVIASDHGLAIAPLGQLETLHRFLELRHRVPLIIYSPLLPGGKTIKDPASQIDVLPTITGLFGITAEEAGIGRDLLDPNSADPERPVITWTRDARAISVITHKHIYHRQLKAEGVLRFDDPDFTEQVILVNPLTDPEGINNLAETIPAETSRLERAAESYFEAYPWLVTQGRSGVPSLSAKAPQPQKSGILLGIKASLTSPTPVR
jgi:arylsulfatase A-like enzyme